MAGEIEGRNGSVLLIPEWRARIVCPLHTCVVANRNRHGVRTHGRRCAFAFENITLATLNNLLVLCASTLVYSLTS